MIKISDRLTSVASFVLDDAITTGMVDVGCDHALLDIYVLENNQNLKIVASDINHGPLQKAKENIEKYSFLDKIKLELEDGIPKIEEDINTIVISGMGVDTIIDILKKGKEKLVNIKKLVISSNNKFPKVREEISKLGFYIEEEKIVYEEGKFYIIMKFLKGEKSYSSKELYFGPILLKKKDSLFLQYYTFLKNQKQEIYDSLPENHHKKEKLLEEIKSLTEEI